MIEIIDKNACGFHFVLTGNHDLDIRAFSKTKLLNWAIDFISKEFDFPRLINISDLNFCTRG